MTFPRAAAAAAALALAACQSPAPPVPAVPFERAWPHQGDVASATGRHGMVATDAALASEVGIEILKAGGNAVDAAVAVGFALAVVYPEAGNLGGGGFTIVRMADGRAAAIDYREVAPRAATRDMFLDDSGRLTRKSVVGPLASGVPGSVAGLVETHERFGALPRHQVMAPAIRLAADGFRIDSQLAASLESYAQLIREFAGASIFLPDGTPLALGAPLRQPALALTLRAIADSGAAAFYMGGLSSRVVGDLRDAGAIITAEDLATYKVEWREPIRATYRGHTILTMPPPSSGVTMVQVLNILEGYDPLPPFGSPRHAHLLASALQRAFIDRNALIADPAFAKVPVARMASKSYAAGQRAGIRERATPTSHVRRVREGSHTTHYSVADAHGNVVATTTTINDLYGSGLYLPTVGIFMNDEMDDFAGAPGRPNLFGLVQGEQNAIEPGKRMLSSMLPTIVLDRAGRPLLVLGARGGPRIISSVTQTLLNVLDHRMSLPQAIGAPRLHHQALPDTLRVERDGYSPAMLEGLRLLGYETSPFGIIGSVNGILRTKAGWVGVSDPRSGGRSIGY